jgi:hypothetical protein
MHNRNLPPRGEARTTPPFGTCRVPPAIIRPQRAVASTPLAEERLRFAIGLTMRHLIPIANQLGAWYERSNKERWGYTPITDVLTYVGDLTDVTATHQICDDGSAPAGIIIRRFRYEPLSKMPCEAETYAFLSNLRDRLVAWTEEVAPIVAEYEKDAPRVAAAVERVCCAISNLSNLVGTLHGKDSDGKELT